MDTHAELVEQMRGLLAGQGLLYVVLADRTDDVIEVCIPDVPFGDFMSGRSLTTAAQALESVGIHTERGRTQGAGLPCLLIGPQEA